MSAWRILNDNNLHPYHRQREQELLPRDNIAKLNFATDMINRRTENPNYFSNILFTDEAGFTKDGIFNQHSSHVWTEENPHAIRIGGSQYKFSINIWCGIIGNYLLGPHVLPPRLNGREFQNCLMYTLPVLLENIPNEKQETMWFVLNGIPPRHTIEVRE
ncbi:Hypothetical protein CINCED_3A018618 [Cinara cedri]|uniref:Uncharacterized protein n=1 Tax=Cinara cedri TaxID=506608 RepID=A0A5E4NBZ7_9HEMI|nr:Hypothetical protein CINCED_3A018618 [Cinara cedri]